MTFDDLIKEAAYAGRLKSLTLWRLNDGRWQANASPDGTSWTVHIDPDPAVALRRLFDAPVEIAETSAFD